jgi:hypothetical protein
MANHKDFFVFLLFLPFLLEATGISIFSISIPGLPLTLGRVCLIFCGILGILLKNNRQTVFSVFGVSQFVILISLLFGSIYAPSFNEEVITFIGFSLLIVSAIMAQPLLNIKLLRNVLSLFFILSFTYWIIYIIYTIFSEGGLQSYGQIYRANFLENDSLVNYHAFGLVISSSTIFILFKYFFKKKLNWKFYIFISISLLSMLIAENRASFIITLLLIFIFICIHQRISVRLLIKVLFLITSLYIFFKYFILFNDTLFKRFDVTNTSYINDSTESRFVFIALVRDHLSEFPFGRGFSNNRVDYFGTYYQPHNQYLSFILGGGYIAFIGIVLWIYSSIKLFRTIFKNKLFNFFPYIMCIWTVLITMLTNDLSGAYFFLVIMLTSWLTNMTNQKNIIKT